MRLQLIRVCGEVQHTGFRRLVWRHAKKLGLKGWVRNLPDGCVEIAVAGARSDAEALVERVKTARMITVESVEILEAEARESPQDFEIR